MHVCFTLKHCVTLNYFKVCSNFLLINKKRQRIYFIPNAYLFVSISLSLFFLLKNLHRLVRSIVLFSPMRMSNVCVCVCFFYSHFKYKFNGVFRNFLKKFRFIHSLLVSCGGKKKSNKAMWCDNVACIAIE